MQNEAFLVLQQAAQQAAQHGAMAGREGGASMTAVHEEERQEGGGEVHDTWGHVI